MPIFIEVRTRKGKAWVNANQIEMIFPRGNECNLRMNEKLFIEVAESAQDIIDLIKEAQNNDTAK
tara:strand:- start:190 stop:384 length:195 start_codon:yes stop_codon:yes gene_type:complete